MYSSPMYEPTAARAKSPNSNFHCEHLLIFFRDVLLLCQSGPLTIMFTMIRNTSNIWNDKKKSKKACSFPSLLHFASPTEQTGSLFVVLQNYMSVSCLRMRHFLCHLSVYLFLFAPDSFLQYLKSCPVMPCISVKTYSQGVAFWKKHFLSKREILIGGLRLCYYFSW